MLRPSFVPPAGIRRLRDYTRLRTDLTRERARDWRHHHRPRCLPPPAPQASSQLLNLMAGTVGEHADRAHTDHDLAGWKDDAGNLDPSPGEAGVNVLSPTGLTASYTQNFWISV
jgi:hypothetical protein